MSQPQQSSQIMQAPPPYGGRTPGAMRYITKLEATIAANDEQLKEARRQIMWHSALVEDLQEEALLYQQALDTVNKQNAILRRRLGLPEAGEIEYTDEETALLSPPQQGPDVVLPEEENNQAPAGSAAAVERTRPRKQVQRRKRS